MPPPPPQPPYGPSPYGPYVPPPRRKMSTGAKVVLGVVGGVLLLGGLATEHSDSSSGAGTYDQDVVDQAAQDLWDSYSSDDQASMCYLWNTDRGSALDAIRDSTPQIHEALVVLFDQKC